MRSDQVHGKAGDQIVFVNRHPNRVRDDHHEQQGCEAGEYEAVNGDDDSRAFQVLQLGMCQFTIDLGKRFLATHRQHGVAEGDHDSK